MSNLHGHQSPYAASADAVEQALVELGGEAHSDLIRLHIRMKHPQRLSVWERIREVSTRNDALRPLLEGHPRIVQADDACCDQLWQLDTLERPEIPTYDPFTWVSQRVRAAVRAYNKK